MFMNVGLISERGIMNRFVQKLIAGAAAVAIAVTGLVGGASTAKAADPVNYSITLNKQSADAADHKFNGWQLAELKDVVVSNDKSITYTIDTTDGLVSTIESAMNFDAVIDEKGEARNVLAAYKQDKNYFVSEGNTSNNPMGFLIMYVFSNSGATNLSSPWNNDAALRTFAQNLEDQTFPDTSAATEFTTTTTGNANVKSFGAPGIWFLKDVTNPAADKESFSLPIITPTSIPDTDINGTVTVKNVIPTISKRLAKSDGTYNDEPSFSVGDTVYYTLETTVPYYTGYATPGRVFQITDTASAAISSIDNNGTAKGVDVVSVKVDGAVLDANKYNVTYSKTNDADERYKDGVDTVIDLSTYVNGASVAEGKKVVVLVKATLDSDAKLSSITNGTADIQGNPNKDSLTWSHNPNSVSDKQTIPGNEVNVYSYKFNILKTAKDMTTMLQGAKFTIKSGNSYLGCKNGAWTTLNTTPTKDTQGGAEAGVFTTGTDGVIDFKGLDAGTYEIEEIVPPNGYTAVSLPKFTFTVSATVKSDDPEGQKTITAVSYAKDATDPRVSVENSTIKIWNAKNLTELPLTGDLGIKVFITVGVLLMAAGAAFALSARMRA